LLKIEVQQEVGVQKILLITVQLTQKYLYFDTGAADSSQNVWGTSASSTTLTFTVGDSSGSNTASQNYDCLLLR
jgi:hypothetical protein